MRLKQVQTGHDFRRKLKLLMMRLHGYEPFDVNYTDGRGLTDDDADRLCDLCGAAMYEVHCKLICPACGYKRDCTDLW